MKRAVLVVALFLSISLPAHAEVEVPELFSEFVELLIGKGKGTHFYPVMMNEQEQPYLDVENLMNEWLELPASCEIERSFCQGVLYPQETYYWIDGKNLKAGNSDPRYEDVEYKPDELVVFENKIWVRYDVLDRWLPVSTAWTLYRYAMAVTPNYASIKELKAKRDIQRKQQNFRKIQRQKYDAAPELRPAESMTLEAKYRLSAKYSSTEPLNFEGSSQILADIYKGTLRSSISLDPDTFQPNLEGYSYENFEIPGIYRLALGDVSSFSSNLIRSRNLRNGISVETNELKRGAGRFEYRNNQIQPNTEVDVYKNGFLQETIFVDETGQLYLPEQDASGGDVFIFKLFYDNGQQDSITVRIAPDDAQLLNIAQWDIKSAIGEVPEGWIMQADTRRGFTQNMSMGLHLVRFQSDIPDELPNETAFMFDTTYRFSENLNAQLEWSIVNKNQYLQLAAIYTGIEDQNLLIDYSLVNEAEGNKANFTSRDSVVDHQLNISHGMSLWGWTVNSQFSYVPKEMLLNQSGTRMINNWLSLQLGIDANKKSNTPIDIKYNATANVKLFGNVFKIGLDSVSFNPSVSTRYRMRSDDEVTWDVTLGIDYSLNEGLSQQLAATYHFSNSLSLSLNTDFQSAALQLDWRDSYSPTNPHATFDGFGTGTVHGRLLGPPNEFGERDPVPDVQILSGGSKTKSDDDGYYRLSKIPTNSRQKIIFDNNSLDVSYTMKQNFAAVRLRPGTSLQFDPVILGSVGFDGMYYTQETITNQAKITVLEAESNEEVKSVNIEADGFFLAEQLSPGDYKLAFTGLTHAPDPMAISIPIGMDWIGGIEVFAKDISPEMILKPTQAEG